MWPFAPLNKVVPTDGRRETTSGTSTKLHGRSGRILSNRTATTRCMLTCVQFRIIIIIILFLFLFLILIILIVS